MSLRSPCLTSFSKCNVVASTTLAFGSHAPHTHTHACTHVHIHLHACTPVHAVHTCTDHTHTRVRMCARVHTYPCMHTCTHVHTDAFARVHMHTHTSVHTHTRTPSAGPRAHHCQPLYVPVPTDSFRLCPVTLSFKVSKCQVRQIEKLRHRLKFCLLILVRKKS